MRFESLRRTILLAVFLLALPGTAWPEMPNGTYAFQLTGTDGVYGSLSFTSCESLFGVTLCLTVDMQPNRDGSYSGTSEFDFSGRINATLFGPATGKLKGTKYTVCLNTVGTIVGRNSSINGCLKGKINQGTNQYIGTGSLTVKIEDAGKEKAKGTFSAQFNRQDWTLTVELSPVDEKRLTGTATAQVGTNTYLFNCSGKYTAKKDESKLKLTPSNSVSKGVSLSIKKLKVSGTNVMGGKLKYKVQGAKGQKTFSP